MRSRLAAGAAAVGLLLLGLTPASPQVSLPVFAGRYRLTLSFGPGCQAQVRSVSISLLVSESAITGATEIDGHPVLADEVESTQLLLLHQRSALHGPFATYGGRTDRWAVTTTEGLAVLPWLMLDGTVTTASGRPQARGTAFGVLQLGRLTDDVPNTLGYCSATDHTWALDPQ
jgi:hypothetical protein